MCSSNFIIKCELFLKAFVLISTPVNNVWDMSLLCIPVNTYYFQVLNFTTPVCVLGSQYDFGLCF